MEGICSMNDIVINVKDATKKFEKYFETIGSKE